MKSLTYGLRIVPLLLIVLSVAQRAVASEIVDEGMSVELPMPTRWTAPYYELRIERNGTKFLEARLKTPQFVLERAKPGLYHWWVKLPARKKTVSKQPVKSAAVPPEVWIELGEFEVRGRESSIAEVLSVQTPLKRIVVSDSPTSFEWDPWRGQSRFRIELYRRTQDGRWVSFLKRGAPTALSKNRYQQVLKTGQYRWRVIATQIKSKETIVSRFQEFEVVQFNEHVAGKFSMGVGYTFLQSAYSISNFSYQTGFSRFAMGPDFHLGLQIPAGFGLSVIGAWLQFPFNSVNRTILFVQPGLRWGFPIANRRFYLGLMADTEWSQVPELYPYQNSEGVVTVKDETVTRWNVLPGFWLSGQLGDRLRVQVEGKVRWNLTLTSSTSPKNTKDSSPLGYEAKLGFDYAPWRVVHFRLQGVFSNDSYAHKGSFETVETSLLYYGGSLGLLLSF